MTRLATIFLLTGAMLAAGCVSDPDPYFRGQTENGNPFMLARVADRIVGTSAQQNDRIELFAEPVEKHYADYVPENQESPPPNLRQATDEENWRRRYVLVTHGGLTFKHCTVRTSGDRVWLIRPHDQLVVAATDLGKEITYRSDGPQPAWATPDGGQVVENEWAPLDEYTPPDE